MTLKELHEECLKCEKCRLRSGATQVVPGEGAEDASIMFIGEGPGKVEDETGRPFVGPAGRFLDELLKSIGLERSQVFIANMVKCRPPGNRDPQQDEMDACRPWLDKQIELIDPEVIVPLGRFAMYKFLPGTTISKEHGRLYSRGGKTYFVMYHPAVALYKGSMRVTLMEDMANLKKFLDGDLKPVSVEDAVSEIIKEKGDGDERSSNEGKDSQIDMFS
ncbi:uracil-DNA glycosylase [Candidatus Dojkabacteria bacterium]|nr:uracil-DNA glycosylase [Candidatus Dojkabacteria bacterium]